MPVKLHQHVAATLLTALVAAGCGGDATEPGSGDPPPSEATGTTAAPTGWSFTDDTGNTVTLDEAPDVIVASSVVAGTLWEYGIEVDAVYGPLRGGDGEPDPQLGLADPDQFESLGEVWGEINIEKLAATEPDVIIDAMWGGPESLTAHPQWEQLRKVAPHIHIEVVDTDFAAIPDRFAELALALGGDAAALAAARTEFAAAADRLGEAARADDMSAAFVSADTDLMYLGVIEGFTDLQYFAELGLDIVQQPPSEDLTIGGVVYWTELSWELADRASADVIFVDTRTYSDINAVLDEHPTWRALPAREAGQIGNWDVEPGYGYGNLARLFNEMAAAIEAAADVTA
jgi:iron complex transport system substrate-binding protein